MPPELKPVRTDEKPEIVRVWGRADSFDIEFKNVGGRWICRVPPDTDDGQYACEINARNAAGKTAFYTGILYMCSGICHLELKTKETRLECEEHAVKFSAKHEIFIEKGCRHGRKIGQTD